jgi:hypothetical protein
MRADRVIGVGGEGGQLRSQGFDAFLKKPFQVRQIVESIEKLTSIIHCAKPLQIRASGMATGFP